jgi:hypothetical protein
MTISDFRDLGDLIDATDHERERLGELGADLQALNRLQPVIEDALGALPYDDYAVLHARYYDDDSPAEVAPQFGLDTAEAARTRLRQALDRLQDELQHHGLDANPNQIRMLLRGLGRRFRSRTEELSSAPRGEPEAQEKPTVSETLEATVEPEDLGEDPAHRRRRGLKFLVHAIAAQKALRVYRHSAAYGGVRGGGTRSSGSSTESEVRSAEDLERAARNLLEGGENRRVRFEGEEQFGSEGLSLQLHIDPDAGTNGELMFNDLMVPESDEPVDDFRVCFHSEVSGESQAFASEGGAARVPVETFDRMLDGAFRISIEC